MTKIAINIGNHRFFEIFRVNEWIIFESETSGNYYVVSEERIEKDDDIKVIHEVDI